MTENDGNATEITHPLGIRAAGAAVGFAGQELMALCLEIDRELSRVKMRHGTTPRAISYAPLVGKYVRMWRQATVEEHDVTEQHEIGMECVFVCVTDQPGGIVDVYSDYGEVWSITPDDAPYWHFSVWPDEETRLKMRGKV